MNFLQKFLAFIVILSQNPVYQKYKLLVLKWLSNKYQSKTKEVNQMGYPTSLPVDSFKYVVSAAKNGTIDDNVTDFVAHAYEVVGYLLGLTLGQPSWNKTFTAGPLDEASLEELYALESYSTSERFGADPTAKAVDPATIIAIITFILNLLKQLGIFKKSETTDVLK